jgi:pimeloyl-ACP methyl ester carboxylesterase
MTSPAVPGLTRHFVTLGARQVHYRRMGSGPALIALHRLPRSSRDLLQFMQTASAKFTVIAPDIAGYGNSWQLTRRTPAANAIPAWRDYVDDIDAVLKELGIKQAALYGEGEGATLAFQLVLRDPKRFVACALNNIALLTDVERAEAAKSWVPFEPHWDGSHLTWLWSYLREENAFSPWWSKSLATRMDKDMPSPEELQNRLVQVLAEGRPAADTVRLPTESPMAGRQGRGYRVGLLSALEFKPGAHVLNVAVPTLFTGAKAFHKHVSLAKASTPSAKCSFKPAASPAEAADLALDFLAQHGARVPPPPPAPAAKPIHGVLWEDFVPVPGGQLHVQMNDDFGTVPLLIQHDAASSVATVEPITRSLIGRRTVLAFDLPGSGESDNTLPDAGEAHDRLEVAHYAEVLRAVLETFGLEKVDFYGMWGGGFVGLELALMQPTRIRRLVMSNVFQHDGAEQQAIQQNYTPPIAPVWHGGHLAQCWHQMRDQGIYYPWFDRTARGTIKREPFLATDMVHERVCSMLKAGNMYRAAYQAHFRYPTYDKLRAAPVPTLVATTKWDPNNPHTEAAAKAAPNAKLRYLDDDFTKWGESFLPFLEEGDR